MENIQSQQNTHRIGRIIQVMIARDTSALNNLESRFRVQLRCNCCLGNILVATRTQLVSVYGLSESKVRQIEYLAIRQQRLRETKQNSDELMSFLGFSDIEDFNDVQQHEFIEYTNYRTKKVMIKDKIRCLSRNKTSLFTNVEALSQEIPSPTLRHDETHVNEEFRNPILRSITRNNTQEKEEEKEIKLCDQKYITEQNQLFDDISSNSPVSKQKLADIDYYCQQDFSDESARQFEQKITSKRRAKQTQKTIQVHKKTQKKNTIEDKQWGFLSSNSREIFRVVKVDRLNMAQSIFSLANDYQLQNKRHKLSQ
ncbi:UNKNOWN [Stylonychia lemnae]|uniref:Uncharacterized protein n=1 Tax=Stylonychia lemnae TaxID=5949 RepID=A0A078ARX8_STYLE|nr:UNKNOWN [Stylonychia lemnae]|eukprot:CDW83638.1 UNKNOWN [Stylonychia lemnae]